MKVVHKKTKEISVGDKLHIERGTFGGITETYVYLIPYPQRLLIIAGDVSEEEALQKLSKKYEVDWSK